MIVLVGELNPYGPDGNFALYPYPRLSAGGRLCTRILGMRDRDYIAVFVLLGRKVQAAFGFKPREAQFTSASQGAYILLPHPSGRCHAWNDPQNRALARALVGAADPTLRLGFKP